MDGGNTFIEKEGKIVEKNSNLTKGGKGGKTIF